MDYKIIDKVMAVVNALLLKWGIAGFENYGYRFSNPDYVKIVGVNLNKLVEAFVSMELLWFCADKTSLQADLSDALQSRAGNAVRTITDILRQLLQLNSTSNFSTTPSIEGYLAAQIRALRDLGFTEDRSAVKPRYIRLKLQTGCFSKLMHKAEACHRLRQQLVSFERDWRALEHDLLDALLADAKNKEPFVKL